MSVYELCEQVKDRDSFINFIKALSQDAAKNHIEWENTTISDYLESISAWMEDSDEDEVKQIDFKEMAKIFYAGKIYE